jgi:putative inorganic carbon (HCO3(-)) transporter
VRDIAISLIIFGLLPLVIKRPWLGVLMWLWISVMNPQKFAFGFAYNMPFAAIVAAVTLLGMMKNWDQVKLPINATTVLFMLFPLWMCVTYLFALEQSAGFVRWTSVMKVFFFILIGASLIKTRKQVDWMIWTIVFSVGFFGIKGGIFTILTGGALRVYGPPGESFMSDNNAISAALVMIIPLMFYLRTVSTSKWVKRGLLASAGLSAMAILGSQSRGAFLAVLVMTFFLWLKSHKKFWSGVMVILLLPMALGFMPETWTSRMNTIKTYEEDASAMGRINAWTMAFNLANDRPLVGGGFEPYTAKTFAKYAPNPLDVHAAHSVYFQILGEHGYVGLALFLAIGFVAWSTAGRIIKLSRRKTEDVWAGNLASAIQVSLLGYAAAGAFINIGYWEIQYYEIVALMAVYGLLIPPERKPVYAI